MGEGCGGVSEGFKVASCLPSCMQCLEFPLLDLGLIGFMVKKPRSLETVV